MSLEKIPSYFQFTFGYFKRSLTVKCSIKILIYRHLACKMYDFHSYESIEFIACHEFLFVINNLLITIYINHVKVALSREIA